MNMQNDVVALVNISTQKWPPRFRTYFGSLEIRSPEPGEAFAITPIHGCKGVMDLGDKRTMEFPITAREIADDLVRELNGDSGEGSYHGVFVASGPAPTEAELAEAHRKLDAFHQRLVEAADLEWERSHNPMFITDLERRAARELNIDLTQSWMVGDRWRDVEAGHNAGCKTVFIDYGYREQGPAQPPDTCVTSLREAADWIIRSIHKGGPR